MTDEPAFSLSEGGRLQSALTKFGLSGGARGRGMLIGMLLVIGWLPLVILSAAAGTAVGGVDHPLPPQGVVAGVGGGAEGLGVFGERGALEGH